MGCTGTHRRPDGSHWPNILYAALGERLCARKELAVITRSKVAMTVALAVRMRDNDCGSRLTSTHTRYTVPIAGVILSISGRSEGTPDVDPTGVVGAAGAGADVWRATAQRVRVTHRRHLAAERRAGLHDPRPAGAGRPGRGSGGRRRRGPDRLSPDRPGSDRSAALVVRAGRPRRHPPRRARHQAGPRRYRAGRRRTAPGPDTTNRDAASPPGPDQAQARDLRRSRRTQRAGLAAGLGQPRLCRRGRDPMA